MFLQCFDSQGREGNGAPTARGLGRLERGLALQPLYRLIDREPSSLEINV